jgi:hypothetical protein
LDDNAVVLSASAFLCRYVALIKIKIHIRHETYLLVFHNGLLISLQFGQGEGVNVTLDLTGKEVIKSNPRGESGSLSRRT